MTRFPAVCLAAVLGLALAGCQSEPQQAADEKTLSADSPADAATRIARDLKDNNLLGAVQAAVPPAHFEKLKLEYEQGRQEPASDEDRASFAENMAKLTAPDAEQALMAELEPVLQKFEAEMAAQMPLMIGMGRAFSQQWLQESKELSDEQKKQAGDLLDAIAKWLQEVKFTDRELARQAIGKAVSTARALQLKTIDDLQALSFEQAMAKGGIAFAGIKDILALYGMKVDEALGSVSASVLAQEGDSAKISMQYRLFGQPLQVETDMVRRDGRWYGKDSLAQLDREASAAAISAADGAQDADGEEEFEEPEAETVDE